MLTAESLELSTKIAALAKQHTNPEWYVALVAAGIEQSHDTEQALRHADAAIQRFPTPEAMLNAVRVATVARIEQPEVPPVVEPVTETVPEIAPIAPEPPPLSAAERLVQRIRELRQKGTDAALLLNLPELQQTALLSKIAVAHTQAEIDAAIAEYAGTAEEQATVDNWLMRQASAGGISNSQLMQEYADAVKDGDLNCDFSDIEQGIKRLLTEGKLTAHAGRLFAR